MRTSLKQRPLIWAGDAGRLEEVQREEHAPGADKDFANLSIESCDCVFQVFKLRRGQRSCPEELQFRPAQEAVGLACGKREEVLRAAALGECVDAIDAVEERLHISHKCKRGSQLS